MLTDRIVVNLISADSEGKITRHIMHDCPIWLCRDLCAFDDCNNHKITGEYFLNGVIEIVYYKQSLTRFQKLILRLLEWAIVRNTTNFRRPNNGKENY